MKAHNSWTRITLRGSRLPRRSPRRALSGLLAVGGILWVTAGCKPQPPAVAPPPIVQVMEVAATNAPRSVEFIGQLDSPQNVEVRARVEAFVEDVLFIDGTNVTAGDPLFRLDKKPLQEQLAAAQGALAQARAALNKCEKDVERLTPLAKAQAIPRQDLENALAYVEEAKANVESAEARVKSVEINLLYCDVNAPISGLIGAKQVSVGNLVGKGEPTLLATISTLDQIWFYCAISEVDYLHAQRTAKEAGRQLGDLPVHLILADGTEHPEPGNWVFLDRAVDATTATIRARAQFPNPDKLLRPGMFARIRISLRTDEGHILVPERALVELQGKSFLWVVDAANKASQRPVRVAPNRIAGNAVILSGLRIGERVVVEGLQKVHEGAEVKPLTAAQMAEAAAHAARGTAPKTHQTPPVKE